MLCACFHQTSQLSYYSSGTFRSHVQPRHFNLVNTVYARHASKCHSTISYGGQPSATNSVGYDSQPKYGQQCTILQHRHIRLRLTTPTQASRAFTSDHLRWNAPCGRATRIRRTTVVEPQAQSCYRYPLAGRPRGTVGKASASEARGPGFDPPWLVQWSRWESRPLSLAGNGAGAVNYRKGSVLPLGTGCFLVNLKKGVRIASFPSRCLSDETLSFFFVLPPMTPCLLTCRRRHAHKQHPSHHVVAALGTHPTSSCRISIFVSLQLSRTRCLPCLLRLMPPGPAAVGALVPGLA